MPIPQFYTSTSRSSNYRNPSVSQRFQPIPVPFSQRSDTQRAPLGINFDGQLPDQDQGDFGSVAGPTAPAQGGRWMYAGDVVVVGFEFRTVGGTLTRTAGSGLFVRRKNGGGDDLLISLAGSNQYVTANEQFPLKQGDILRVITIGPTTLEMVATVTVLGRNSRSGRP